MKIKTTFNSIEEMRDWANFIAAVDTQRVSAVEPEIKINVDATEQEKEPTPVEKLKEVQKAAVDKAEKAAAEEAAAEEAAAEEAKAEEKTEVPALTYDDVINRIKNMKINGYPKIAADVAAWKTAGNYPSLKDMEQAQLQLVVEFLDTKEA